MSTQVNDIAKIDKQLCKLSATVKAARDDTALSFIRCKTVEDYRKSVTKYTVLLNIETSALTLVLKSIAGPQSVKSALLTSCNKIINCKTGHGETTSDSETLRMGALNLLAEHSVRLYEKSTPEEKQGLCDEYVDKISSAIEPGHNALFTLIKDTFTVKCEQTLLRSANHLISDLNERKRCKWDKKPNGCNRGNCWFHHTNHKSAVFAAPVAPAASAPPRSSVLLDPSASAFKPATTRNLGELN
jgi:hypothetical protein